MVVETRGCSFGKVRVNGGGGGEFCGCQLPKGTGKI